MSTSSLLPLSPKGGSLTEFRVPGIFGCDECGKGIPANTVAFENVEHKYVICCGCYQSEERRLRDAAAHERAKKMLELERKKQRVAQCLAQTTEEVMEMAREESLQRARAASVALASVASEKALHLRAKDQLLSTQLRFKKAELGKAEADVASTAKDALERATSEVAEMEAQLRRQFVATDRKGAPPDADRSMPIKVSGIALAAARATQKQRAAEYVKTHEKKQLLVQEVHDLTAVVSESVQATVGETSRLQAAAREAEDKANFYQTELERVRVKAATESAELCEIEADLAELSREQRAQHTKLFVDKIDRSIRAAIRQSSADSVIERTLRLWSSQEQRHPPDTALAETPEALWAAPLTDKEFAAVQERLHERRESLVAEIEANELVCLQAKLQQKREELAAALANAKTREDS